MPCAPGVRTIGSSFHFGRFPSALSDATRVPTASSTCGDSTRSAACACAIETPGFRRAMTYSQNMSGLVHTSARPLSSTGDMVIGTNASTVSPPNNPAKPFSATPAISRG